MLHEHRVAAVPADAALTLCVAAMHQESSLTYWPVQKQTAAVQRVTNAILREITRLCSSEQVPTSYIRLMNIISCKRTALSVPIVQWDEYRQWALEVGLDDDTTMSATKFLHWWGEILYFVPVATTGSTSTSSGSSFITSAVSKSSSSSPKLASSAVIIDPRWMIDLFRSIISFNYQSSVYIFTSDIEAYVTISLSLSLSVCVCVCVCVHHSVETQLLTCCLCACIGVGKLSDIHRTSLHSYSRF
jgi:hypothetical protein